jgi:hypothetical protein
MCFGLQTTSSTSYQPNAAVSGAATSNLTSAQNLQSAGFQPYSGQMVAGFSPQQASSFAMGNQLASSGVPNVGQAQTAIGNAAGVGPQSVTPSTISSAMNPYMNQYVSQALAPQIQGLQQQFAGQDQQLNAAATSSGAFGDARAGIQAANLTNQQNTSMTGLLGQAYTSAFNTAIGAGAQDVSNSLAAQTTNANLANTYAGQQLGVGQAYENLGGYQIGQGTALTNLQNTLGGQQTAQQQAQLNAQYQQYLMAQQYPFLTSQNLNQSIGAASQAMPATSTTQQPNNAGWALAGALGGSLLGGFGTGTGQAVGLGQFNSNQPGGSAYAGNQALIQQIGAAGGYYAEGGSPPVGVPSVVGERGPEVFVPTQPGVIIPNHALNDNFRTAIGMAA